MNLSAIFIRRPVATTVIMLALILAGLLGYQFLPVSDLPPISFPTITVSASLSGADPQTMATSVALPLEKRFSTIDGLSSMNSVNSQGQTVITLQFELNRNIDSAAQDVSAALSQANKSLPSQMTSAPSMRKVDPSAAPVLILALTADHLPMTQLDDYAENRIAQCLSMINGVAQVTVLGGQPYAVRIELSPLAMAARNISIEQLITTIAANNPNLPSGSLQSNSRQYAVTANGQLNDAKAFNQSVIAYKNAAPVLLQDIGTALDSVENTNIGATYNKQAAIILAIQRQPNANSVDVVDAIKNLMPTLTAGLPGGLSVHTIYDRSAYIRSALNEVKISLFIAILLVVGIIFLFLENLASTLIAAFVLPVSLIATFGAMYLLDCNLDNLSLMALVLSVGFVVDDAIVVLENIARHIELGKDKLTATYIGSQEIGFTVISMTLSLVAVFIPILFMAGLMGRLFHEFAIVTTVAVLLSGFVSLSMTPMLCSRFLSKTAHPNPALHWFETFFNRCKAFYQITLRQALLYRKIIGLGSIVIILLGAWLFMVVPKGFIPTEDIGMVQGSTTVADGVPFSQFMDLQKRVVDIILRNPNVLNVGSSVGQSAIGSSSSAKGRLTIQLKPLNERTITAQKLIQILKDQVQAVPGIRIVLNVPPAIPIGGKLTSGNYQYVLQGPDLNQLEQTAQIFEQKMMAIPGIQNVDTDSDFTNPTIQVHILRKQAAILGVSANEIENTLYAAYGQYQVSTINKDDGQYSVIIEINPRYQKNISSLNSLYVQTNAGNLVPLSSVAQLSEGVSAVSVNHYNQLLAIALSFDLQPGVALGDVTDQINSLANELLPSGVLGNFSGSAQLFQSSMANMPLLLLITVLIIYFVLAILYEDFWYPFIILTAIPLAGVGALIALLLCHSELDVFSLIGIIMLIGIAKKNGIMMVDFAVTAKKIGNLTATQAILDASLTRFRPIMMTTMAALLAAVPIALGFGAGGQSRQPLGISVVGGLIFSQALTLYITPVFYVLIEDLRTFFRKK